MRVTFWGVRGSVPSPGLSTLRYGGNTSCLTVDCNPGRRLVLDAGTGIRALGRVLEGGTEPIVLLLSHTHWDHIQGFPFFEPIYQRDRVIDVFAPANSHSMLCGLVEQMDGFRFPVTPDRLPSRISCITADHMAILRGRGFDIARIATNHPGGGWGYRIASEGRSVVYLTDNELEPPPPETTTREQFAEFCRGADVLIHDAQYLESDMGRKHGWGHSVVSHACRLAVAAQVKHLVLYHHDPERDDAEIDAIQDDARAWLERAGARTRCSAAFEGLILDV
ncbi:MAG: MBL fold metallo-hydrolase [Candidatus Rokubacteria bacterium]|nr:MBL fold metallo-hydrolase [Candidatus Rokubacteria bacterium]MBI3106024.1 MBL fold metallo-hydrolase [Candidatus Rokubacteria bacterium]